MADEEIRPEVYYIPENFDDAGGVLGGHFSTRNAIRTYYYDVHDCTFSGLGSLWYRWREFISNTYGIYSIYSKTS